MHSTVVELCVTFVARARGRAIALALGAWLVSGGAAWAQSAESSWNVEGGVGWDISLSGDFLSAGIGTLNSLTFGVNGGALYGLNEQIDVNAQVGFRVVSLLVVG